MNSIALFPLNIVLFPKGPLPLRIFETRYVDMVTRSGAALLEVIEDVLDFSKIEAGRMDLEEISFDPRALVSDVAAIYEETARKKGLTLGVVVDPALPGACRGDPARIRQVLANFLSNLIKFRKGWRHSQRQRVRQCRR